MRSQLALLLLAALPARADSPPVRSVQAVDIERYVGDWYEIARYPKFFQRRCLGDSMAHYELAAERCLSVVNRCRTAEGTEEAKGKACTVEGTGDAQLKVSFFWPFRSDYWIIGLDPEYRWAVVGNPQRTSLWILSRSPELPKAQLDLALKAAAAQGYDLDPLQYTPQRNPSGAP